MRRPASCSTPALALLTILCFSPAAEATPPTASQPLHLQGSPGLVIERRVLTATEDGIPDFAPLPQAVIELLGPEPVEYDSFVVTYPGIELHAQLTAALVEAELGFTELEPQLVHLPHHSFDPKQNADRTDVATALSVVPAPIGDLWLVQFAYPIRPQWLEQLSSCGLLPTAHFPVRTLLLRGDAGSSLCGLERLVSWSGPYLSTDRASAEFLSGDTPAGYWLQFIHDTDLEHKSSSLPEGVVVQERFRSSVGEMAFLHVTAAPRALAAFISEDPDLLSVVPAGIGVASDERQGAIIAGLHDGVAITTPSPGYRSWLANRGLLTASNQQTVGVIDLGYDDGGFNPSNPALEEHHLDLERPERLADLFSSFSPDDDQGGHGTLVAGIIVGDGSLGTGSQDEDGYYLGTGIAPAAKLAVVKTLVAELERQEIAIEAIRSSPSSTSRGHIINQSWNMSVKNVADYRPVTSYEASASFFDARTLDANTSSPGSQPTLFVYSAGNFRQNCNGLTWNTVSSPALAKNVLAVGATRGYRPFPVSVATISSPPLDCRPCTVDPTANRGRPPNEDANDVSRVADFSGRGQYFTAYPGSPLVYTRRIKPDTVAPGVRVYSTVPYDYVDYDSRPVTQVHGCTNYYPPPGHPEFGYHTYGTGTSFAAPVVSGAAALLRKRLLDSGIDPKPSLLKAGIIATADDLGGIAGSGNDHRPSPKYGWGRVNLDRLTDNRARFYRNEVAGDALSTGQSRSWARTIGNGNVDTYVVLAWSDPPAVTTSNANAVLVNDLDLQLQNGVYRGNIFNETIGVEDGYSYPHPVCACPRDTVNNVEAIFIPAGTFTSGQSVTLSVLGTSVPQGPQSFALYAYNVQ